METNFVLNLHPLKASFKRIPIRREPPPYPEPNPEPEPEPEPQPEPQPSGKPKN